MRAKLMIVLLASLLTPGFVLGGVTGKIKGKVTDKESGETLVGANVAVEGTGYGAATDVNGEYLILNVPAGVYTVKATLVGYGPVTVLNVRVSTDLTTDLDFQLSTEAVALEAVEIIAERPLVNPSATNAVRIVSAEDLANIPIRGIASVVALQPGVIAQGGEIFIRGGRQDEVGYFIDGADARNPRTGRLAIQIVPQSLEEFQVQAGGYNAEYGGANAGIVRQQLRTGTSRYSASLRFETDNFKKGNEEVLGTTSFGYTDYSATLSGPIYSDKIKFFLAGQNVFQADPTVTFWDPINFPRLIEDASGSVPNPYNLLVTDPTSPYFGKNAPDTISLIIPGGNVPGRKLQRWAGNGTLTFDYNPLIVRFTASMNLQKELDNIEPVRNIFNQQRLRHDDQSSYLYTTKITFFPAAKTFIEGTVSYSDFRFKRYDPLFEDDYLAYGDSVAAVQHGIRYFRRFQSPQDLRTNGFPFRRPGEYMGGYTKRKQQYISAGIDATHQLENHEIKVGGSWQRYTIRQYIIARLEDLYGTLLSNPDAARNGGPELDLLFRTGGVPDNFGYDIYGNEIDGGFDGPKHPTYTSAYVQDKFEVEDLVINAGVRFDRFDNDDREFIDGRNPGVFPDQFNVDPSTVRERPPVNTVSPRLGFSFPVTDRTVFHMQYGKFVQAPQLRVMYVGTSELARVFSGRNFIPVPFSNGLDPIRTTQYEIGFTQQFADFASFDITTFYKDIKGQVQVRRVIPAPGAVVSSYSVFQNGDFATTKGVEFALRLRRVERVQGLLSYTLSDAQGTGSSLTTSTAGVEQGSFLPNTISPLQFSQAHRGTINLDYRFAKDDAGSILERLGANLLFTFNSGHAYTKADPLSGTGQRGPEEGGILADDDPRSRNPAGALGSSTTPWVFQLDLKVDKTVTVAGMFDVNLYVYVQNLLNTKNVYNVYVRSGSAEDDGFLTNPILSRNIVESFGPTYVEMYRAINLQNRQHYWRNQLNGTNAFEGGDIYGPPRQIRFGINVSY